MNLIEIDDKNFVIFYKLVQDYEREFAKITDKKPNKNGEFELDTNPLDSKYFGFLASVEDNIIGFAIVGRVENFFDIAEFYIDPEYRNRNFGKQLAFKLFDKFVGDWQVRQIEGADEQVVFWEKIISSYTENNYLKEIVNDSYWGIVTRERFKTKTL